MWVYRASMGKHRPSVARDLKDCLHFRFVEARLSAEGEVIDVEVKFRRMALSLTRFTPTKISKVTAKQ